MPPELAAAIQAKQVSATEVLEAHIDQIERHNPALNAVVTLDAERAHQRARHADEALARVADPEYAISIVDLGLIYGVEPTAGGCFLWWVYRPLRVAPLRSVHS